MMVWNISGSFADRAAAERAVADLRTAGFDDTRLTVVPLEQPGPPVAGRALRPSGRAISGGVIGALVLGAAGLLLGGLFSLLVQHVSPTTTAHIAGPLFAALCGILIGWLLGSIIWTRAPVEEGYTRQDHREMGWTRLLVAAGADTDEVRQILQRDGARDVTPNTNHHVDAEPDIPHGATD
jgi:hypothetical protein